MSQDKVQQIVERFESVLSPFQSRWEQLMGPLHSEEDKYIANMRLTLGYCVLIRVAVISAILGATAWGLVSESASAQNAAPISWLVAGTYILSLINVLWLKRTKHVSESGYVQLIGDVLLATTAIYFTGGSVSPLFMLYLLVVVSAGMLYSWHGAIIIAATAGISYSFLSTGLLPPIHGAVINSTPQHILSVYFSLFFIALISGYLSHKLHTIGGLVDLQGKKLTELSNHQRQLFEDISEGIISLDMQFNITSINKAACAIFGISNIQAQQLESENLPKLLKSRGVPNMEQLLKRNMQSDAADEICFRGLNSEQEICINYKVRPLTNSEGEEIGRLVLFDDVSHVRRMEHRLSMHEEMTKLLAEGDGRDSETASTKAQIQIVGDSAIMQQVMTLVGRVASSEASVLISGESGTGKELFARAIHQGSNRADKPFIVVNCGAIPENLIESELFGYKKGSFTGATSDRPGLFRQANGGTIFLDEIGELPLHMQTKLLRVLQEKTVRAVGDVHEIPIDVRVVSATNRDLKDEVAADRFREDLFYRLNVVNIMVPPLRERKDDVPLLVRYFIGRYCEPSSVLPQISPEALERLMNYSFPGNIRELENIIERALVLGGQAVLPEHLPLEVSSEQNYPPVGSAAAKRNGQAPTEIVELPIDLERRLADLEMSLLKKALDESGGVKKQAAELLGLNFRSFRYRLKKYGLGETGAGE